MDRPRPLPSPVFLGGKEGFKSPVQCLWIHTCAGIFQLNDFNIFTGRLALCRYLRQEPNSSFKTAIVAGHFQLAALWALHRVH